LTVWAGGAIIQILRRSDMKTMFVLQVQGWGDDEDAFENVGVYDSRIGVETAQRNLISEALDDGLDAITNIEEFELNA
jgi:hypothetical protein